MPNMDEVEEMDRMRADEEYRSSLREITRSEKKYCEYKKNLKKETFLQKKYLQCSESCPYGNQRKLNYGQHEGFTICTSNGLIKKIESVEKVSK